jgi:hypothetical protein
MNKEDACSVVFIEQQDGWVPVDLKEEVAETSPEPLKSVFNKLIQASKIAEDFDLYCIFSVSLTRGVMTLEGFATPGEHKEDVSIPASVSSAVLTGLSMFLGDSVLCDGLFNGSYSLICSDEDGNAYMKYTNIKDSDQMSDKTVCAYAYNKDCRFIGSYSTVDNSFIDKDGKTIKLNEKSERMVKQCFEFSRNGEGESKE